MASNLSSSSDEAKPFTIRLPESELAFYDVLARTMGMSRQEFFQHLIRSYYRQAFREFASGYCQSEPSISLEEFMQSHTSSEDIKRNIHSLIVSISNDEYEEHISELIGSPTQEDISSFLPPIKGLLKLEEKK